MFETSIAQQVWQSYDHSHSHYSTYYFLSSRLQVNNVVYDGRTDPVVWYPATVTKADVADRKKPNFKKVTMESSCGKVTAENDGELAWKQSEARFRELQRFCKLQDAYESGVITADEKDLALETMQWLDVQEEANR